MSEVHVAKCWECGWRSPAVDTASSAELYAGWHAIGAGCPIGGVQTVVTSEVSA